MNTALTLKKYHTYEQGAGRIQVDAALQAKSLVEPSSLHFGKFLYGKEKNRHKAFLTVENIGNRTQRYSFHLPFPQEGMSWRFPLSFTLEPKQKKAVEVELSVTPSLFKKKIQDGYLMLNAGSELIQIPYLYVLEEPDYPRVMGFDFGEGDRPGSCRYEVYLPGGAEEFGIALFDPNNFRFVEFLDTGRDINKGFIRKTLSAEQLPPDGMYLAKVFAKKAEKEDFIETLIMIKTSKD